MGDVSTVPVAIATFVVRMGLPSRKIVKPPSPSVSSGGLQLILTSVSLFKVALTEVGGSRGTGATVEDELLLPVLVGVVGVVVSVVGVVVSVVGAVVSVVVVVASVVVVVSEVELEVGTVVVEVKLVLDPVGSSPAPSEESDG